MICIVCPIGCFLEVKEEGGSISVAGNKCSRGEVYAKEEILAPKRVVTATCPTAGYSKITFRVPVKTATPCPKEKIPLLLDDIYKTEVNLPVKAGDTVLANWQGLGIDIVATRTIQEDKN
jgi:CxxC motif-containing protein